MEQEIYEIKNSIYVGMSIYDSLRNWQLRFDDYELTKEDKKFLGLYLGIMETDNKISEKCRELNYFPIVKTNYKLLDQNKYIELYINSFFEIFNNINFESMNEYLEYLLKQTSIIKLNENSNIDSSKLLENSNKVLLK